MAVASNMRNEGAFPWPVRRYGLLGLAGAGTFLSSLLVLHLMSPGIDWVGDYVSNLVNEPLGWVFIVGAFVHGWGNLALTLGLRGALHPGRLRTWAVLLFGLAAVGILVAALFPFDPPDQAATITGRVHRTAAGSAFALELAALFVFSVAFGRHSRWRRQQAASMVLSVSAAVAIAWFAFTVLLGMAPGLAERTALVVLLVWELWVCFHLIRPAHPR